MTVQFDSVPLADLLNPSEVHAEIEPGKNYQLVTVKLWGKGVELRNEVDGASIANSKLFVVRENQFILSKIDARNGAFGLIPSHLDQAVVSPDFPVFTPNLLKILPKYLNWISKTAYFINLCVAASEGTTNRVRLKIDRFLATAILLPSLEEQHRIVARIEEVAAKIEEARGLRQLAKEERDVLTGSILKKLFSDLDNYTETTLENVCEDIIDNLHSNPVYAESGIACIRSPDVGWGKLHLHSALKTTEEEYINRTARGEPKVDDIVFVREGGGTGKVALVEEGQRFSLGQRVMMFRLNQEKIVPKFFLYQMLSPLIFQKQILPQCKGSASPHINIGVLRNFSFILPSLDEQKRLIKIIDELHFKTEILENKQKEVDRELDALLPSILDKAFKGEL